jgi:hypothetical protein
MLRRFMFLKQELTFQHYLSAAISPAHTFNQKKYHVIKIIKSLNDLKNS